MNATVNIIGFFFEPESTPRSFRTVELTKGFCEMGFKVRLVLPDFHKRHYTHPNLEIIETPVGPFLARTAANELPNLTRPGLPRHLRWLRVLGQRCLFPDINALWIRNAFKHLVTNRTNLEASATLSIGLPIAPMVLATKLKRAGLPVGKLIAEYGDPAIYGTGLLQGIAAEKERRLLRHVDVLTVNFSGAVSAFEYRGIPASKIRVVPHILPDDANEPKWTPHGKQAVNYVYGGAIYGERDISKLLAALKRVRREGGRQTLTVFTSVANLNPSVIAEAGEYLTLRQKVSPSAYRKVLLEFDAAINFIPSRSIHLPSKRMDFGAVGIPVFEIHPSDSVEDLAKKLRAGEFSPITCKDACTRSEAIAIYSEIIHGPETQSATG
ncbi:MAG: hypothetical protein R3B54_02570 [Bdellovibrionota bacterium]